MSATIPQAEAPALAVVPTQQPVSVPPVDPNTPAEPQAAQEIADPSDSSPTEPARDDKGRFTKAQERIQRQISDLTANKHTLRREVEALQSQAQSLRKMYESTQRVDPNDYDAVEAAKQSRAVIGVQHSMITQQAEARARDLNETRQAAFFAKIDAARTAIPELDASLNAFARLPLSEQAADLIVESDKSVEIANFLGRNPQEAIRIAKLHPAYQGAEIARIEARVSAQPIKRISQAPAPVQTVSGGPSNAGVDLGSLSMADYMKARMGGAG